MFIIIFCDKNVIYLLQQEAKLTNQTKIFQLSLYLIEIMTIFCKSYSIIFLFRVRKLKKIFYTI